MRMNQAIGGVFCAVLLAQAGQEEFEREYRILETQLHVKPALAKGADSEEVVPIPMM